MDHLLNFLYTTKLLLHTTHLVKIRKMKKLEKILLITSLCLGTLAFTGAALDKDRILYGGAIGYVAGIFAASYVNDKEQKKYKEYLDDSNRKY